MERSTIQRLGKTYNPLTRVGTFDDFNVRYGKTFASALANCGRQSIRRRQGSVFKKGND